MPNKILVATPHPAFGELLRISLEENGPYQVRLVQSSKEAQSSAERSEFALAIVDADLKEPDMPELARRLQSQRPALRLMVIPLENNAAPFEIEGVRIDGRVNRPYYLPELLQTVQDLLTPPPASPPQLEGGPLDLPEFDQAAPGSLPWQRDPQEASAQLTALLPESSADSLLILRARNLLAFVGRLDDQGAQQITAELVRYWDGSQKSDLVRFLSRESPDQDSLLYATALADEYVLALVYDIPIPLTRCRAQSGKLVRLLMTSPQEEELPVLQFDPSATPLEIPPVESLEFQELPQSVEQAQPFTVSPLEEYEVESAITDEDEEAMTASLAALLDAMPHPDAVPPAAVPGEQAEPVSSGEFRFPWELEQSSAQAQDVFPPQAPTPPAGEQAGEELPGWLTAGGEPVSPFNQPVVDQVWWEAEPQAQLEEAPPQRDFPSVPVPGVNHSAPLSETPEPAGPPEALPAWLSVPAQPLSEADLSQEPAAPASAGEEEPGEEEFEMRLAWEEIATQPLTAAELPVEPAAPTSSIEDQTLAEELGEEEIEMRLAWEEVATQPLTAAELPVEPAAPALSGEEPPAREEPKPRPAWEIAATQPLTAAQLPLKPPAQAGESESPTWEIADTQPQRVKKPASAPVEQPDLGETRRVRPSPSAPQEDHFLADTRPRRALRPAAQEPSTVHLQAPPPPLANTCACVLIPHIPEHYLVGGMADMLKQALIKAAAQNHWKVSQVLVRPQYLQWITESSQPLQPDQVADTLRKRLSAVIFKQYPALKNQNRSGNFWAQEYLAQPGNELIPAQRLRTFTRQARASAEPIHP